MEYRTVQMFSSFNKEKQEYEKIYQINVPLIEKCFCLFKFYEIQTKKTLAAEKIRFTPYRNKLTDLLT